VPSTTQANQQHILAAYLFAPFGVVTLSINGNPLPS